MTNRFPWRRRLLLAAGLGILLLAGLEGGLRLQGFGVRAAIWFDPGVGYRNQPNQTRWMIGPKGERLAQIETNDLGFRGPLPSGAQSPERPRIMTLGDSFTFGLGAPEGKTFPARLERSLADADLSTEVFDMSFPGWAPSNELAAYSKLGRDLQPKVVVLGFTLDDLKPADSGVRYTDNFIFRWFGRTATLETVQRNLLTKLDDYRIEREPAQQKLRDDYDNQPLAIQANPRKPMGTRYWDLAAQQLETLRKACEADGGKLLVAAFPSGPQVRRMRKAKPGPEREAVYAKECAYQRELIRRCEGLGIELVDLLPRFVAAPADPMGVQDKSHPGPVGYQAMADGVAEHLATLGWL